MIPSESLNGVQQPTAPPHRDHRGVPATNVGWRLPCRLIEEIKEIAAKQGVRPGAWVVFVLQGALHKEEMPLSSSVLQETLNHATRRH